MQSSGLYTRVFGVDQDVALQPPGAPPRLGDRSRRQPRNGPGIPGSWAPGGRYVTVGNRTRAISAVGLGENAYGKPPSPMSPGYPYWCMPFVGDYWTYRMILDHPTVRLVRALVMQPIAASTWSIESDPGSNEQAHQWCMDNILKYRREIVGHALRMLDFGNYPFSIVWLMEAGKYIIDNFKAMLPDLTIQLQDQHGNFAGIVNQDVEFNELESIVFRHDAEPGNPYGRPRLENLRTTAWPMWLNTAMKSEDLATTLSGIIPIVTVPGGGYYDESGQPVYYVDEGAAIVDNLPQGNGVVIQSAAFSIEDLRNTPELAGTKLIDVDFYDAGNYSAALEGFINRMEYADKLIFRGYYRSERTGTEATQAGSRADSAEHGKVGVLDDESIDDDIAHVVNTGPLYNGLTLNFGREEAWKHRIKTPPLGDRKREVFEDLVASMMKNDVIAVELVKILDVDRILRDVDVPAMGKLTAEALEASAGRAAKAKADAAEQKQQQKGAQQSGKPEKQMPTRVQINDWATRFVAAMRECEVDG